MLAALWSHGDRFSSPKDWVVGLRDPKWPHFMAEINGAPRRQCGVQKGEFSSLRPQKP